MAALAVNIGGQAGTLLMGLLAAHDKRVAAAKSENAACNAALAAMVHDIQTIAAAISAGEITVVAGIQSAADVDAWYWQYINPFTQYKNANPGVCNPNQFQSSAKLSTAKNVLGVGSRCFQSTTPEQGGKQFTAASSVGCNIIDANLGMLVDALQRVQGKAPGSSVQMRICGWPGDKYGLTPFAGLTVTITIPVVATEQNITLSQSGILQVGASPNSTSATIVPASGTAALVDSLGLGGISTTNLLVGAAAIATIIVAAVTLRGSR
jgi:hypothetical protein